MEIEVLFLIVFVVGMVIGFALNELPKPIAGIALFFVLLAAVLVVAGIYMLNDSAVTPVGFNSGQIPSFVSPPYWKI